MPTATLPAKGSTPADTAVPPPASAVESKSETPTTPQPKAAPSAADVAAKLAPPTAESKAADDSGQSTTTPESAPVVYDFKGADGKPLAGPHLDSLKVLAGELKLAPEAAQRIALHTHSALEGQVTAAVESLAQEDAANEAASKADPHLGGRNYEAVTAKIDALFDEFGPEVAAELKSHRDLKRPQMRLFFARIAAAMAEGGAPLRGESQTKAKDPREVFYPKHAERLRKQQERDQ